MKVAFIFSCFPIIHGNMMGFFQASAVVLTNGIMNYI